MNKTETKAVGATDTGTPQVLFVTGLSGAGKTSALKSLEDMGYEAVDNVPLSLLAGLVLNDRPETPRPVPMAIGVDIRTRDFNTGQFLARYDLLRQEARIDARILFLDCDDRVLAQRYTETRHRHPMAQERPVSDGIQLEREIVAPLKERADMVVDTSDLTPSDLRRLLDGHFSVPGVSGLTVFVTSFAYRNGLPREADIVFDVRFLINPHYDPALRPFSGRDERVKAHIMKDDGYQPFFDNLTTFLKPLLPRYEAEGKSYLTIAIGCTGGQHRSVFVAEELASWLEAEGQNTLIRHRDVRPEGGPNDGPDSKNKDKKGRT